MRPLFGGFPIENKKVMKMSPLLKKNRLLLEDTVQYLQYVL